MLKNFKNKINAAFFDSQVIKKLRNLENFFRTGQLLTDLSAFSQASVLVLAPHPDDEAIGCGGALRKLANLGCKIDVAYLSDGEKGFDPAVTAGQALGTTRKNEAKVASEILGLREIYFLGGRDAELHLDRKLDEVVARLLAPHRYQLLLCPWPYDFHSDHAATFQILRRALKLTACELRVWLYETWSPVFPNRVVSIDEVVEPKKQAIRAYQSQMITVNYEEISLSLARYRALLLPGSRYAEAFLDVDASFIRSQVMGTAWLGDRTRPTQTTANA